MLRQFEPSHAGHDVPDAGPLPPVAEPVGEAGEDAPVRPEDEPLDRPGRRLPDMERPPGPRVPDLDPALIPGGQAPAVRAEGRVVTDLLMAPDGRAEFLPGVRLPEVQEA